MHGQNNLQAFTDDLHESGGGAWQAATAVVNDPAMAQARRWASIQDLRSLINGLEGDAQEQEDIAYQLEHTANGKTLSPNSLMPSRASRR